MSDPVHDHILLACPDCKRAVAVYFSPAAVYQGLTNLDDHRKCSCGREMVETTRDEDERIIVPERRKADATP